MTQLIYIFRMLFAALCGSAIGYERENHLKMAGIRTHMIVAVTASLMMILSKYGFWDVLERPGVGWTLPGLRRALWPQWVFWGPA